MSKVSKEADVLAAHYYSLLRESFYLSSTSIFYFISNLFWTLLVIGIKRTVHDIEIGVSKLWTL